MSLPGRSIARPVAVSMAFVAVVVLGLISARRLPIDLLPDLAYPRLIVYTGYPDVAPAEVERLVTERVEQAVARVPGVQGVESVSREATSLVTLRFAWGTDMDFAALNVRERLDDIRDLLPELAAAPVVLRTDPRSEPVMALSVAGPGDLRDLLELTESVFRRRLEQIDGVAQAATTGGLEREIHVDLDPRLLESYGITIADVTSALQGANASAPGGTVRRGRFRYALRTLGELTDVAQIGDVVVGTRGGEAGGAPVALREVAVIEDGVKERESIARHDGREAIGLLLFKESGANTVQVAERVDEVLAQLRQEYPEVTVEVASSQAGFIAGAIVNVVQEIVLGALLAFLVLLLFMRNARYPLAISLAIPISVIGSLALLDAFGVSLNIMSLGGIALGVGMLVDNSIVVTENIFRHREKGLGAALAAAAGAQEVQAAITASTLTTVAVFGPVVYVQGVAGALFEALSFAVAFTLLASILVALMLLPMLAARLGGAEEAGDAAAVPPRGLRRLLGAAGRPVARTLRPVGDAFDRGFQRFAARYERALDWSLDHRGRVVGAALVAFAATLVVATRLERSLLPDVDQGAFRARIELPRGTPLEATDEAARRLEAILAADSEVSAVFTQVGRRSALSGVADEESGLNTAVLDVRLEDGAGTDAVVERLRPRVADFPPGALSIATGQATALGQLLDAGEADLAVRVRGDDLDAMLAHAAAVERRIAGEPALANVRIGTTAGQPEIRVEIDRERAAAFGVEPRRIAETIDAYMRGSVATEFADFDRRIPVVVRLPEAWRRRVETLDLLRVDGIPLRELVRTTEGVGPSEIRRRDQSRYVPVYADVAAGGVDDAIEQVGAALDDLPPPAGLAVEIGGENEEMRRGFRDLAFAFAIALLLVYMILAAEFESFVHPFTVLLSVPLALIGAVFALWVTGAGLNTVSLIGFVILVGIVDNDAVVKVDFINQARARGLSVREAIREGGRARLRPIVMTTLTTMIAVLPMALGFGAGAELQAPMAIAVLGGLFTATALTLIVIPVAYDLIEELRQRGTGGRAVATARAAAPARAGAARPEPVPAGGAADAAPRGARHDAEAE